MPTPLNILLCNLSSFREHYINKKTFSSLLKLLAQYQPCIIVCYSVYFWLIRSFTDPAFTGSIFVYGPLHHHGNRDLTHIRRRRRGRHLAKNVFLFYFGISYLDLFSVSVGIKTCPCRICYECVQFHIEIRKISRCGSRSPNNLEFGHFTLLFCRGRQRNVPRIIMHVHSYCFAH